MDTMVIVVKCVCCVQALLRAALDAPRASDQGPGHQQGEQRPHGEAENRLMQPPWFAQGWGAGGGGRRGTEARSRRQTWPRRVEEEPLRGGRQGGGVRVGTESLQGGGEGGRAEAGHRARKEQLKGALRQLLLGGGAGGVGGGAPPLPAVQQRLMALLQGARAAPGQPPAWQGESEAPSWQVCVREAVEICV